ncbi:MAG: acyltransferase [Rhizobium sp.]|nr:acyltransferase [Rhizobium sp.]
MTSIPPQRTLDGIQYLRAAAAIAVVLFHAAEKTGYHFAIGAAGVDVFFVISGFIMWVVSARREPTSLQFLRARIRRIVPVYWLATAVMVAGALAGLFPNLVLSVEHVLASLFFIPARSPSNGEIWPVLVQGWTLNYEMFFYVVFAGTLLLPRVWRLPVMAVLFGLLVIAGASVDTDNPVILTYTRPIILEFVVGMVIGEWWLRGRVPAPAMGFALIALALSGFTTIQVAGLTFDAVVCGPLSAALVVGVLALEARQGIRIVPAAVFLGDASYAIYLSHTFAISVVAKVGGSIGVSSSVVFVGAVLAGVSAGTLGYYLLEKQGLVTAWRALRVWVARPTSRGYGK